MKLNVKAFALTSGIIWSLGLFALTWWIIAFDGVTHEVTLIGRLYRGYDISPLGSLVGLVWGFFDAIGRFVHDGNPSAKLKNALAHFHKMIRHPSWNDSSY